jgi:hypothetical protein
MPTNVVKSKEDEAKWAEAKSLAAKQGKGDNYAYIMSIYQSLKGEKKSDNKEAYLRVASNLITGLEKDAAMSDLVKKILERTGQAGRLAVPRSKGSISWLFRNLMRELRYMSKFPGRYRAEKLMGKLQKAKMRQLQRQLKDFSIADEKLMKELLQAREAAARAQMAPYFKRIFEPGSSGAGQISRLL